MWQRNWEPNLSGSSRAIRKTGNTHGTRLLNGWSGTYVSVLNTENPSVQVMHQFVLFRESAQDILNLPNEYLFPVLCRWYFHDGIKDFCKIVPVGKSTNLGYLINTERRVMKHTA